MTASNNRSPSKDPDGTPLASTSILPTSNPAAVTAPKTIVHPAFYVTIWIALSSSVILFNKWILHTAGFPFPIFLTTWHLLFATIATQVLAKTTHLLDGRKTVKMTGRVYVRAILPIGVFFSMSLICGNQAYLYLSVAFIQMLKATTPVAVLLVGWGMNIDKPNLKVLGNVSFIVIGIILASYGEIAFNLPGFIFQTTGIMFEAIRLVLVQRLLSSAEYKMDPLVSLYYFAPICAVMNFIMFLIFEGTTLKFSHVMNAGLFTLLANATVAFGLNVSVVFLIGKTCSLVLTLCGVLKDILLVTASVIIWGTTISGLQIFGYAIALGGLVYYKLGADKLREHYIKLRTDGNLVWQEYGKRHPAWRKATVAGGVMIFLIIAVGEMYPKHNNDDMDGIVGNSGQITKITPPPSLALRIPTTTLDNRYHATRKLDIVVSLYKENPSTVAEKLQQLVQLKAFAGLEPNLVVYFKDPKLDAQQVTQLTGAHSVKKLGDYPKAGGTYLTHIIEQFDDLAEHTLFINADFHDYEQVVARIEDYFVPKTGMLSLAAGHAACSCLECKDPWGTTEVFTRIPQIFSAVYNEICPPVDILLSYAGQSIVSARRIRSTNKHVYESLRDVVESEPTHWIHKEAVGSSIADMPEDPHFAHVLDRSWMIAFKCADPRLASSCPRLNERRQADDPDDKCQCIDLDKSEPRASKLNNFIKIKRRF